MPDCRERVTAADVECAIGRATNIRADLLVANVSWGLVSWGEIDLLSMSQAGYLTEFEIKVSRADLKREWKKKRWTNHIYRRQWANLIKRYYMAVPENIYESCIEFIPDWAGVVVIEDREGGRFASFRRAGATNKARALTEKERYQLARLGAMRYWRAAAALQVERARHYE